MSLGTMLDVGVGLIFVFLLLGLVVSALQEAVASLFALRGKYLLEGISTILADRKTEYWLARAHILPWSSTDPDKGSDIFKSVSEHALIRDITPADVPSYVPAGNFAMALIDTLRKDGTGPVASQIESAIAALPDGPARQALNALFVEAKGDVDAFQKNVEAWFDTAMDRVSGVYKRWTQYFALVAGIAIAVALNANSILIAEALWTDPTLRDAAVKEAQAFADRCSQEPIPADCPAPASPQPDANAQVTDQQTDAAKQETADAQKAQANLDKASATYAAVKTQVLAVGYPIGWTESPSNWTFVQWIAAILGWLMTGLAVSLGAPFWFGLLKTFLNIRGAGPNPAEKQAQK